MMGLNVDVREIKGIPETALVTAEGAVDFHTGARFRDHIETARSSGLKRIILDLDGLTYINSSGLATLINLASAGRAEAPTLVLLRVRPRIKVLIDLLRLDGLFRFCHTLEEAVDILGKTRAPAASATR